MAMDEREYARKRAEQRAQSIWFKLKEGENCFRILPTPKTKTVQYYWFEYAIHRDVGPKKVVVRCGIDPVTETGDCWLCNSKIPALKKKNQGARAAALAPKSNFLIQVAKVSEDGSMTGPFLFTPAKTVADQLLASIFGAKKRSYVDPVAGFNISITRTGTGKNDTRYAALEADQEPTKVPKAILEKLKPFEDLKEVPTYSAAKQEAAYNGRDVVDDEEDEEEEAPPPRRPKASRREEPEEEEDYDSAEDSTEAEEDEAEEDEPSEDEASSDEDESEETSEDEDEEPPPPRKPTKPSVASGKTGKKPSKPKPEPEPEDDDDLNLEDIPDDEADLNAEDEEEEEPPPPPKKPPKGPTLKPKKRH